MDIRAARKLGLAESAEAVQRQAMDKLAAARIWLTRERPLFGVLARSLRPQPCTAITAPLAILPDDRLLVEPELLLRTPFPQLCARVAHVVLHAALGGFARRGSRPLPRWNLAHDLAIDPLIRAAGLESDYGIADEVVSVLPEDALAGPRSVQGGSMAAESVDAALQPLEAASAVPLAEWVDLYLEVPTTPETEEAAQGARPPDEVQPDRPIEGKGAVPLPGDGRGVADVVGEDGEPSPDVPPIGVARDRDEPPDEQAQNEARRRTAEVSWRMRLAQAMAEDQAAGSPTFSRLPKWAREWMQATVEPPPSWTAVLQTSVAHLTRGQRSYLRPSRRSAAIGWDSDVRLPGRRVVPAGQLAAVVDTSGSIDEPTVRRALGAVAAAANAEGLDEVRLLQADAAVTDDRILSPTDLQRAPIEIKGRGGTRFWPALKLLAREARRRGERGGVVYLTDLEGEFGDPDVARALDVLWVTTGSGVAPFGRTVRMR